LLRLTSFENKGSFGVNVGNLSEETIFTLSSFSIFPLEKFQLKIERSGIDGFCRISSVKDGWFLSKFELLDQYDNCFLLKPSLKQSDACLFRRIPSLLYDGGCYFQDVATGFYLLSSNRKILFCSRFRFDHTFNTQSIIQLVLWRTEFWEFFSNKIPANMQNLPIEQNKQLALNNANSLISFQALFINSEFKASDVLFPPASSNSLVSKSRRNNNATSEMIYDKETQYLTFKSCFKVVTFAYPFSLENWQGSSDYLPILLDSCFKVRFKIMIRPPCFISFLCTKPIADRSVVKTVYLNFCEKEYLCLSTRCFEFMIHQNNSIFSDPLFTSPEYIAKQPPILS
jgi:hypothetical protein